MRTAILFGLVALCSVSGCGKSDPAPTTPQATVSGSVTYDGVPVTLDANVIFFCADAGATAAGKVDSLGKYALTPAQKKLGIPAGRYQVGISPPAKPIPPVGDTPEYKEFMLSGSKTPPVPKDLPAKFHSYTQSGIVLEVKAGENTFDFDLAKLEKAAKK